MPSSTPVPSLNPDEHVADLAADDNQIWTAGEKAILKSHVEGYRGSPRKSKAKFVVDEVIPRIKTFWRGRYDRKKLSKDPELRKEWRKKKEVRYLQLSIRQCD
jgi:hypothetical protein